MKRNRHYLVFSQSAILYKMYKKGIYRFSTNARLKHTKASNTPCVAQLKHYIRKRQEVANQLIFREKPGYYTIIQTYQKTNSKDFQTNI